MLQPGKTVQVFVHALVSGAIASLQKMTMHCSLELPRGPVSERPCCSSNLSVTGMAPGTMEISGGANVLGPGLPEALAVATVPLVEHPDTREVPFWVAAVRWAKGMITCQAQGLSATSPCLRCTTSLCCQGARLI